MMSEEENAPSEPAVDSPELDTSPLPGEEGSEPEAREIRPDDGLLHTITAGRTYKKDVTESAED